ncbi:hypothetical protein ACXR0M_12295 [Pseudomonas sp. Eth.TT006]
MKKQFFAPQPRWSALCLGLLAVFAASSAQAIVQEIRATFSPDPAYPHRNLFINKTPVSGYCADRPQDCQQQGMFSIRLPVRFDSVRAMQPGDAARNSAMFLVPAQWKPLTVTNTATGETETVEIRIVGFGSQYVLDEPVTRLTGAATSLLGHQNLWGGPGHSWVYAAPLCEYSGVGLYSDHRYAFFWKTPSVGTCVKTTRFLIPTLFYDYLDFAYELKTPNPLKMSSGIYTGSLSYRVGPGGDFDMGDVMSPNDPDLTLNFTLDVKHTLKVELPPGGERIQLLPPGGWQRWLQSGRKPVQLSRDQLFHISASSRFKMFIQCSLSNGRHCFLSDTTTIVKVPLKVSVTLPDGLTDTHGLPVRRQELLTSTGAVVFRPSHYVDRQPGTLHFELQNFDTMFLPGLPNQYSGKVTVIWDSEI